MPIYGRWRSHPFGVLIKIPSSTYEIQKDMANAHIVVTAINLQLHDALKSSSQWIIKDIDMLLTARMLLASLQGPNKPPRPSNKFATCCAGSNKDSTILFPWATSLLLFSLEDCILVMRFCVASMIFSASFMLFRELWRRGSTCIRSTANMIYM